MSSFLRDYHNKNVKVHLIQCATATINFVLGKLVNYGDEGIVIKNDYSEMFIPITNVALILLDLPK